MKISEISNYSEEAFLAMAKLLPQLGPGTIVPTREHFRKIVESVTTHFFILEADNRGIAGILSICTYPIPTGTKAWIEDVVVDECFRGKSYGKALMLHAIEFARSQGAKAVELTSRPSRIAANRLYKELGFVIRETNLYKLSLEESNPL